MCQSFNFLILKSPLDRWPVPGCVENLHRVEIADVSDDVFAPVEIVGCGVFLITEA